jgi:hypothetical protein
MSIKAERGAMAMELRQLRIEQAKKIIKGIVPAEMRTAIATVSLNLGVTIPKAREYVLILRDLGYIRVEEGIIKE